MIKTETGYVGGDRYSFDFNLCRFSDGWAQLDTRQDASYYGAWANPEKRQIVSFCEGDLCTRSGDCDNDFIEMVNEWVAWAKSNDTFLGIDTGCNQATDEFFDKLGLKEYQY